MPIEARRHNPRVKLNETAYIIFGSGNRGVILDVSEGGLRFKTTSPLKGADLVRFGLTLSRRSEATAAVAWTDQTRAVAGLRFTKLPADIREQIRLWIDRSLAREISGSPEVGEPGGLENNLLASAFGSEISEEPPSSLKPALAQSVVSDPLLGTGVEAAVAKERTPQAQPSATAVESLPAADFSPATRPDPAQGFVYGGPTLVAKPGTLSMFPAGSVQQQNYVYRAAGVAHHRLAIAALVILLALAAAAGAAAYYHPSEARHLMTRVEAGVTRLINHTAYSYKRSVTEVEPAAMGSAPEGNSGGLEGSLEPAAPGVTGMTNAPRSPGGSASKSLGSDNEDAPLAKGNSQLEMNLVQKYLTPGSTPDEKQKAVQLLWHATEKGNVDAEIQLADLYARGDSVPKSCVQARILLKAAATVNPSLAQPKLAELDDAGCS